MNNQDMITPSSLREKIIKIVDIALTFGKLELDNDELCFKVDSIPLTFKIQIDGDNYCFYLRIYDNPSRKPIATRVVFCSTLEINRILLEKLIEERNRLMKLQNNFIDKVLDDVEKLWVN